jgi:hypothetical protein
VFGRLVPVYRAHGSAVRADGGEIVVAVTPTLSRLAGVAGAALLLAAMLPPAVGAAGDLTPPTGSMEYWAMDNTTQLAELRFAFSDPESGLDHIEFMCDGGPDYIVPYATTVFLPMHDGTAGCSTTYGIHEVLAWVVNGDGLKSAQQYAPVENGPTVHLTVSASPTTGHLVTVTPVWSSDYTVPAGTVCRWEFRWGTTTALDQTYSGETFGGMTFDVPVESGGCGPWTFTLPWVPYRQYDVRMNSVSARFIAAVDSTDRRILSSNLPIAQVLPSTYTPIVGEPITYTRYLIGGASGCCNPQWSARLGDGENPKVWSQSGGSTFTFTPTTTGDVFVEWNRVAAGDLLLDAYYDPPVRYRDTTAPVTTAPRERIRALPAGTTIPLLIDWSGSDKGWGIASYTLQRSLNGGTWTTVALSSSTARSVGYPGTPGTTLRFRVRAKDKAGNVGGWTYGPTFKVLRGSDAPTTNLRYTSSWSTVADAGAFGGVVHQTTTAGGATSYKVYGRDVAWVASRGPDHGKAKVWIDGAYIGSIDLYAATAQARQIVFAWHWTSLGTHLIRIENVATAGRPIIDCDGYAVLR